MTEERKVIIRLENVTYKYKVYQDDGAPPTEEKGVQNVSLEIFEGEFLALVGHNGSGQKHSCKAAQRAFAWRSRERFASTG